MADQFIFEEANPLDWLKDTSQFTDKHFLTHSQVSQQHFFQEFPQYPHEGHIQRQNQNNPHTKQKNKVNAKNYRDRKKKQIQFMQRQITCLQQQNALLKKQKVCRWCKKSYSHNIIYSHAQVNKAQNNLNLKCSTQKNMEMQVQFQKPQFFGTKRQLKNGKIWIALGLLMLVLGLTLYGVNGDCKYIKQIQIQKEQIGKWVQQFKNGKKQEDYIQVKMRLKQERKPVVKVEPSEIRILYRSAAQLEKEANREEQETISINKQFLYSIHAEMEDIGFYL